MQKIALHINPGVFYAFQPRNKHYELSNHLGNVLAVISDMKLYTCHEFNKFEDFENNPNINGDWNIGNSWEGQNAVLDLAYGKLHVVDSITSNPHVRINYLLPKHLQANQTYRIKFDLEHIIGDQNWQIGVASSNTDSTYESNFSFFSGSTSHNEITFRPTGPIWRIRFLHLPVGQNMEFYLDNFSIENLSLDSNTIAMADIVSATDYYPFGAPMPGRSFQSGGYRFGFNGKENDNEVKGDGNEQDYGMRISDTRLGRFLSVDPLTAQFPWWTPYQFAGNMPIKFIDLDGMEPMSPDVPNSRQADRKINKYERKLERFAQRTGGSSTNQGTTDAFNTSNADKRWMYVSEENKNSGSATNSGSNSESNIETIWYSTAELSSIRRNPDNVVSTPTFGPIIQIRNVVNAGMPSATTANSATIPFALPVGGIGNLIITNNGTNPINVSADQNNSQNNPTAPATMSIIPTTMLNPGAAVMSAVPANMANDNVLHSTGPGGGTTGGYSIGFQPLIGNIQTRTPRFKIGSPIIGSSNFGRDGESLRSYFGALLNY